MSLENIKTDKTLKLFLLFCDYDLEQLSSQRLLTQEFEEKLGMTHFEAAVFIVASAFIESNGDVLESEIYCYFKDTPENRKIILDCLHAFVQRRLPTFEYVREETGEVYLEFATVFDHF